MKRLFLATLLVFAGARADAAGVATMRVDYYHTGNATEERFSLDRTVVEPLPWPGNPARPIDDTNRGKYLFEVADRATGKLLFSRGFSSIYGEWETTPEAKEMNRTFSESLRFPLVDRPARIVVKKRDAGNLFRDVWSFAIDPADKFVERGKAAAAAGSLIKFHDSGDPAVKLDLLILGDGYTGAQRGKFERDARRLIGALLATSPFKERQGDINIWGLSPASAESGISRPSQHIFKHTPLGTSYDAFDSERYVLTFENRAFRDIASNAPYDVVGILVMAPPTAAAASGAVWPRRRQRLGAVYVLSGHHLRRWPALHGRGVAAAADRVEPWEPNVTAFLVTDASWRDLLKADTPLPTPYEARSESIISDSAAKFERRIDRSRTWTRSFERSLPTRKRCSGPARTHPASARLKGRITKRAVSIVRRWTASCSRGTPRASAPSAAGRFRQSSTSTAGSWTISRSLDPRWSE